MWPVVEPGRPFVRGWAIEAICQHLEAVTEGRIRRLLINVPPGFMKSLATCVFWPAWEWIRNPSLRYIFASYVGSLSLINNTKLRRLVESDVYQQFWGSSVTLTDDQNAKTYFETTMTGFAMATSVGGAVMGKRGDRVILDDPNNTKDTNSDAMIEEALQFLTEVLPTRINDEKTFAQVTIMQRTGERDVAGHLLDRTSSSTAISASRWSGVPATRTSHTPSHGDRLGGSAHSRTASSHSRAVLARGRRRPQEAALLVGRRLRHRGAARSASDSPRRRHVPGGVVRSRR
jgi:hypothetical protein